MTYLVAIYLGKECLMERGEVSESGLRELLKYMSSLRNDGRSIFIRSLKDNGFAVHKPEPHKQLQYSFAAVKVV